MVNDKAQYGTPSTHAARNTGHQSPYHSVKNPLSWAQPNSRKHHRVRIDRKTKFSIIRSSIPGYPCLWCCLICWMSTGNHR